MVKKGCQSTKTRRAILGLVLAHSALVATAEEVWDYSSGITHVEQWPPGGFQAASRISSHQYGVTGCRHQGGFRETKTGNLIRGFPATNVPHPS